MKRIILTLLVLTIGSIFLFACGGTAKEDPKEFRYADLLPSNEEIFGVNDITILDGDDGDYYIFEIPNVTRDQYEKYLGACKENGFTESTYENLDKKGGFYGAYTQDGKYWVELDWDEENGILSVCCNKSKRYDELIGNKEEE